MAAALDTIPSGANLLIDTNIFVYGLTAKSPQCETLLKRCSKEEVSGITLFEIVHDATHVFMIGEARAKGLASAKVVNYLQGHPEQVKQLADYWENTQRLLTLNIVFLPMEKSIVVGGQAERKAAGLLTIDSIIISAMREYGISFIATNDRYFDGVSGISVFSPTDVVS